MLTFMFDIQGTVHRDIYLFIIKAKEIHYFSTLFIFQLYLVKISTCFGQIY